MEAPVSSKAWYPSIKLCTITSLRIVIFIVTATRTLNLILNEIMAFGCSYELKGKRTVTNGVLGLN
jgi:hypothetical protein